MEDDEEGGDGGERRARMAVTGCGLRCPVRRVAAPGNPTGTPSTLLFFSTWLGTRATSPPRYFSRRLSCQPSLGNALDFELLDPTRVHSNSMNGIGTGYGIGAGAYMHVFLSVAEVAPEARWHALFRLPSVIDTGSIDTSSVRARLTHHRILDDVQLLTNDGFPAIACSGLRHLTLRLVT